MSSTGEREDFLPTPGGKGSRSRWWYGRRGGILLPRSEEELPDDTGTCQWYGRDGARWS